MGKPSQAVQLAPYCLLPSCKSSQSCAWAVARGLLPVACSSQPFVLDARGPLQPSHRRHVRQTRPLHHRCRPSVLSCDRTRQMTRSTCLRSPCSRVACIRPQPAARAHLRRMPLSRRCRCWTGLYALAARSCCGAQAATPRRCRRCASAWRQTAARCVRQVNLYTWMPRSFLCVSALVWHFLASGEQLGCVCHSSLQSAYGAWVNS